MPDGPCTSYASASVPGVRAIPASSLLLLAAAALQAGVADRLLAPLRPDAPRTAPVDPATADGVAALVDRDFSRFDRNGDGRLSDSEFARCMPELRAAPVAGGEAAEARWVRAAFDAADLDAGGALSRTEVAAFIAGTVSWRLPATPAPSGPKP